MTHFCQLEVCPQSGNLHNICIEKEISAPLIDYICSNLYCHSVAWGLCEERYEEWCDMS